MTEPIVRVENLSHRYSVQWAVKNVDFEIADCGIYGLLGSNGAGKSTIMNIICGVLKQTNGNVFINGIDMRSKSIEAKKHIGFLPQKPPLHPDLTVEEYLIHCANLRMIPEKEIKTALDSVLAKCAITHFRKRLIKNLSGGYQQRVGIAQAIIHNPNLVVLDEPTNGLDPNQTVEIRNLIKEIARERTVLLSTHILSEVQATCDYIRMVEEGKVVFAGTVDEFDNYIEPNTVFVSLLESPSVDELKAIPGVLDVEELEETKYRVKFSDSQDIIEKIVETSVSKGWRLNEIRMERSSLDTIFAELSKSVK
ncbi:MAG: multidrug ABC transporter ATP-binding protein [Bacteroidetes bacterium GWE2_39_28]|nr:MAG: multidrug ABC transporter ATP-binding protein [Bacteroidetes bacterium GWE2_39_28]OFY13696.1 MAG: multidrug ABC transporter ATP-binding protein [Bacteroidetes bacterium GWF2_39_10]OFZ07282.1 MAG: multidrug ABC transporter ATP-binding protein [Bacteroidetes bacterium RIFOXYB2_FULL_39_7]OFZ10594.1 MAG: multidrug ABC transporter ATP-binding protein [Bacteroidetes bacterium RIFOXYC2_FULL_39_11]